MQLEILIGKTAARKIQNSGINILTSSEEELVYIAGKTAARKIQVAKEMLYPSDEILQIRSVEDAANILLPYLRNLDHERFYVIACSNANKVIDVIHISSGGLTGTVVDTRILFKRLLICGAASFIVSHNHPSGNLTPSQSDIELTAKIKEGARLLDLKLLDHIIIGKNEEYYSFLDKGIL